MKKLFETPAITIEELERIDVLCDSDETDPNVKDNANLSGLSDATDSISDLIDVL